MEELNQEVNPDGWWKDIFCSEGECGCQEHCGICVGS